MTGLYCDGNISSRTRQGFTIIELSLSILFIAILSIAIVFVIMNAISSYHRGLTLNKINTVGMDLVDDMRLAIQSSPPRLAITECSVMFSGDEKIACEKNNGQNFVMVAKRANVKISGKTQEIRDVPVYGAFCTGSYSYIWNSGYYFNDDFTITEGIGPAKFIYQILGDGKTPRKIEGFKLLKVEDKERRVCISAYDAEAKDIISSFDITNYGSIDEEPVDILSASDEGIENNLALYDLYAMPPVGSTRKNNIFYSVSFILGTIQGGINIMAAGDYCTTPVSYSAVENFDYCAINKFNFAVQATGGYR